MSKIKELHNPYDFSSPVSQPNLFVGREKEMKEICYYLDQTKTAPKPINVALLGERASGKTSILNIAEQEARDRGFCAVRVDLNQGDSENELAFFFKLFDSIFSSACEMGAFGGKDKKTFECYIDMISTYIVPEASEFCPFFFPILYAKAMGSNNENVKVSDVNFKKDLLVIREEVKKPIIVLFDEANVLTGNNILLQKLRNILQNISGYMVVMTGTPELFPVMNEVFSPMIRQFKRIIVNEFIEDDDIEDCVRKPLKTIEQSLEELFGAEYKSKLKEINELTNGRPYEINLICHFMFKRIQEERADKMVLDFSVLEEVRRQLEITQDMSQRKIISKLLSYDQDRLNSLSQFLRFDNTVSFDELWRVEYVLAGGEEESKKELGKELNYFIGEGILKEEDDNKILFVGDNFEKTYFKYYLKEKECPAFFLSGVDTFFIFSLIIPIAYSFGARILPRSLIDVEDIDELGAKMGKVSEKDDVFVEHPEKCNTLYQIMSAHRRKKDAEFMQIRISSPQGIVSHYIELVDKKDIKTFDEFVEKISPIIKRAEEVGIKIECLQKILNVIPIQEVCRNIMKSANKTSREKAIVYHVRQMLRHYLDKKNLTSAIFHAEMICEFDYQDDISVLNSVGYIFLVAGRLEKSQELLENVLKKASKEKDGVLEALIMYNLFIIDIKLDKFQEAVASIEKIVGKVESVSPEDRICAKLLLMKREGDKLSFDEIDAPDLYETVVESRKVLKSFLGLEG